MSAGGVLVIIVALVQFNLRAELPEQSAPIEQVEVASEDESVSSVTTIDVIAPTEEQPLEEDPKDFYHLATMGDMIALFDEQGAVVEVYEIYVHILPPDDIKQLNVGIKIENEQHLRQLLEDFGG